MTPGSPAGPFNLMDFTEWFLTLEWEDRALFLMDLGEAHKRKTIQELEAVFR